MNLIEIKVAKLSRKQLSLQVYNQYTINACRRENVHNIITI